MALFPTSFLGNGLETNQATLTLNIVASIVILIFGLILGRFLSNLTRKLLDELELDRILKEKVHIRVPVSEFISSSVKYVVYILFIILSLNQLGIENIVLNIVLGIIFLFLFVFILAYIKDFIPNFIAGIKLYKRKSVKKGDIIKVNTVEGRILNINILETKILSTNKEIIHIPNSLLNKFRMIKRSE